MLESGYAPGALDKIPGPMDARFLSSVGLGFGTRKGRTQLFPVPALDKYRFPTIRVNGVNVFLGPAFGRTDFSRIFIFEPPDFFADFLAGFFLLIFVGKSAQKNPPGKSPGKSSNIFTTKILQHISANCPGQVFA